MNDTAFDEHLVTSTPEELALIVEHDRLRAKVYAYAFGAIMGITVLLALVVVLVTSASNNRRIDDVTRQLAETRAQLVVKSATQKALDSCQTAFASATRSATREYTAAIGDLVVVISTVLPEDREAVVGDGVTRLQTRLAEYRAVTDAQAAWGALPDAQKLPCPIDHT